MLSIFVQYTPSDEFGKIKAEIFKGPQIRQLMKDSHTASQMTEKNQLLGQRLCRQLKTFWEITRQATT